MPGPPRDNPAATREPSSEPAHEAPTAAVARNLRRLRGERGMSLSTLARASGVGKATLSALETGGGNPTIETLWALANALGVPFGELLARPDRPATRVVRSGAAPTLEGAAGTVRLLERVVGAGLVEVYDMTLEAGQHHEATPHAPGVVEHLLVITGRVRTGPVADPVTVSAGDLVTFAADRPHRYAAPDGPARMVLLLSYPATHRRDTATPGATYGTTEA